MKEYNPFKKRPGGSGLSVTISIGNPGGSMGPTTEVKNPLKSGPYDSSMDHFPIVEGSEAEDAAEGEAEMHAEERSGDSDHEPGELPLGPKKVKSEEEGEGPLHEASESGEYEGSEHEKEPKKKKFPSYSETLSEYKPTKYNDSWNTRRI